MARMQHLRRDVADGLKAMYALEAFLDGSEVPKGLLDLLRLRVSQLNGCSYCVDMHSRDAKKAGETDERLFAVAAWRESPHFTDAERAALGLAEAATRISDNPHGVPDDVWEQAREHFDEPALGVLTLAIAAINAWNRINVINRTVAGGGAH